ncbi:hypothetical protein [Nocardia sp. R7R-8]
MVDSVDIAGVDRTAEAVQRGMALFMRHSGISRPRTTRRCAD